MTTDEKMNYYPVQNHTLSRVLFFLLFIWLETMALCSIIPHWFDDLTRINGAEGNPLVVPVGTLAFGVLMLLPLLFLWRWKESDRYRAVFRSLMLGVLFYLLLLPIRLLPQTQILAANLLQLLLAALFTWLVRRRFRPADGAGSAAVGVAVGLLFALPCTLR